MNLLTKIDEFENLEDDIWDELDNINIENVKPALIDRLCVLLKNQKFEAKVFGIVLKARPKLAHDHLYTYYLGKDLSGMSRCTGNLDVMFGDYREILGEEHFEKLISGLPEKSRNHPVVKAAIRFATEG